MGLTDRIAAAWGALSQRSLPLSFDEWSSWFSFNSNVYGINGFSQTMPGQKTEDIDGTYGSFVQGAYRSNGVIFACMLARMLLFSEARFQFQALRKGKPGDLFSTPALSRLETPGPNQTTRDLLNRMIQDADLAGNWYGARRGDRIRRLRPDWVTIVMGSESDPTMDMHDIDADVIGYLYHPGGRYAGNRPEVLLPGQVAHFAPIPDPQASFRGMSWITPIVREVMGDSAARDHKLRFFENGATPNMVVTLDKDIALQAFRDWVAEFKGKEPAGFDAYKTLYLGAGATASVVGANLRQLDFKLVQGAGETRICAAARVPPIIVGVSEGLQAATYSNYGQARRAFADLWARPTWGGAAGSLAAITDVPAGSRLWYDEVGISFLQEDVKDAADIQAVQATSINGLVTSGFTPESAIDAVIAGDFGRLVHTGLYSVQLQPPGTTAPEPTPDTEPEAPANA